MTFLHPRPTKDAPGYRRPLFWASWRGLLTSMFLGLTIGGTLGMLVPRHAIVASVTAVGPAQPREELLHDQVVIVDQSGKTVLSPVMSRSDAIIEVDRWNNGYYHPNKELLPVGWVPVTVTRK